MRNGIVQVPPPINEPVRDYAPGSPEKVSIKARLDEMLGETVEIPVIVGGREIRTGNTAEAVCPHDHSHVLATFHQAGEKEVQQADGVLRSASPGAIGRRWPGRTAPRSS